jgi:hypothetical protein
LVMARASAGRSTPIGRLASTIARNPSPGWAVTMISPIGAPSSSILHLSGENP